MRKRTAFTLIELLVVIAIIALLMAMLMPVLSNARNQAKAVICQLNLKQWGFCFAMYAQDNNNRFMRGWVEYSADWGESGGKQWMNQLRPYYANYHKLALCPMTRIPEENWRLGGTFLAWANLTSGDSAVMEGDYGSYGINDWAYNPQGGALYLPEDPRGWSKEGWYWRGPGVEMSNNVPLFFDCIWTDAWPDDWCPPPEYADYALMTDESEPQMQRVCIKRHDKSINILFMDYSVRKVGLKELWTLKWHPHFDINGPWTIAGFGGNAEACAAAWDEAAPWMRNLPEY